MHAPHEIVEEIDPAELDCVFISYDEPNAEMNWALNRQRVPWLKRVHGVKGFDAAHKAAAELARTKRFFTIDGDTLIDAGFMDQRLRIKAALTEFVFSWKSLNVLHGLCYGNGSLKCWPRSTVLNMRTHEVTTDDQAAVEFCWSVPFRGMISCWSQTNSSASPYQAFRSGFREGCKITLENGQQKRPAEITYRTWSDAMGLLKVWCGVGADQPNGLWSIYGARAGLALMMEYPTPDFKQIADYDWFVNRFEAYARTVGARFDSTHIHADLDHDQTKMLEQIEKLGRHVRDRSGIELALFDPHQSAVFKTMVRGPVYGGDPMVEG
jgi:hypothetical protein